MSTWKAISPKMTLPIFCCCSVRFGLGILSTSDAPAFWQVNKQRLVWRTAYSGVWVHDRRGNGNVTAVRLTFSVVVE